MKKSRIKAVLFSTALGVCTFTASYAGAKDFTVKDFSTTGQGCAIVQMEPSETDEALAVYRGALLKLRVALCPDMPVVSVDEFADQCVAWSRHSAKRTAK